MFDFKKTIAVALCAVIAVFSASCSKNDGDKKNTDAPKDEAAINQKYDELMKDVGSDAEGNFDGLSFQNTAFSAFDFSLYPAGDETAVHSIEKNSFGKVNLGGTYFNSIAPGGEAYSVEESFVTAKRLGVTNSAQEFIAAYAIENGKALYKKAGDSGYRVLQNGTFEGKLTAIYASGENGFYQLLEAEDVQKFLNIRDQNASGMYFDPSLVNKLFSQYDSVAVLDLEVNDIGQVFEFSICRFEETSESDISH